MRYLKKNPGISLGIDESDQARAYMYYRCLQNNFDYLTQYFEIYGVNYYIRILRKIRNDDVAFPLDVQDIIAVRQVIDPSEWIPHEKLYNCIIFRLRTK